ncbi:uncharacterized protein [Hetaerina americana]|uniref:uncharacterized protein n=1 Tax=Hetaerina americana TaxID=62018 RepID=UPI003A7F21CE
MSAANVDNLLEDEDGEEEYDLGNEEEEALLAGDDDQEVHHENISYLKKSSGRKNQYVGDNKMYRDSDDLLDDILDLDDVESDLENTEYTEDVDFNETQDDLDGDEQHAVVMGYHGQGMHKSLIESEMGDSHNANADVGNREDMTEMLKQNPMETNEEQMEGQKDSEDEEEEEREEGRGRFKSERTTVISLKGSKTYGNIPDTLDGVLTGEEKGEVPGRWRRSGGGRGQA